MSATGGGPLAGVRILELEGLGPGPFASMLLSDLGADVVTVVRPEKPDHDPRDFVMRGRDLVALDLKRAEDVATALALADRADVLIEGMRPGVMERLGLGPEVLTARNPALIYARMTGWGQHGPLADRAGHDINYISITGALGSFRGPDGTPVPPLNLVGDYGGGALYLTVGILAALHERTRSGRGQTIDAAMCDGVGHLLTMFRALEARGRWRPAPRSNHLDGGAHFYGAYRCADGKYLAVGAIEPKFYDILRGIVGLDEPAFDAQLDRDRWPELRARMEAVIATKTRDAWASLLEHTDACATPILDLGEAPHHPHLVARGCHVEHDGHSQPAPAPRFSRTPAGIRPTPTRRLSAADVLGRW